VILAFIVQNPKDPYTKLRTRRIEILLAHHIAVGFVLSLVAAAAATAQYTPPNTPVVSGLAHVIDADTMVIGEARVRLEGIDAPETDQVCLDAKGQRWTCGIEARDRLKHRIEGRELSCVKRGKDRYSRTLAICSAQGQELNPWLVREGLALAYVQYSHVYVPEQTAARDARKGMWSGAFIAPWDWRHRNKQTIVLGALSVSATAQSELLAPVSSVNAPSPDCIIKGNINQKGERIYHMPGQRNYARINMADSNKRWFCSEEEAEVAGWSHATR
jgi:endonuclease YncB( thermonuclease family)